MKQRSVLILILNYGSPDLTKNLIQNLEKLAYNNYKILVVDNCSPDNSVAVLRDFQSDHDFLIIESKVNNGYAAGNNIGLKFAIDNNYDYTWILNSDLVIEDLFLLDKLVSVASKDDTIGGIGPQIIDINGNKITPYINRPSFWDMSFGIVLSKRKRKQFSADYTGQVYRIYGCCMLVDNETMNKVGLFDSRTFLYYEEDILAEKFLANKKCFYHIADTSIIHLESMTVNKAFKGIRWKKSKILQRSFTIYLREYRNFSVLQTWLCKAFNEVLFLFF